MTEPRKRITATELTAVVAECGGCTWRADKLNALPLAAQHHDTTGHEVTIDITRRVVYGDGNAAREAAGQTTLEDALAATQDPPPTKEPTDGTTHR